MIDFKKHEINKERLEAIEKLKPELEKFINKFGDPHSRLEVTQKGIEFNQLEVGVAFNTKDPTIGRIE